MVYNVTTQYKNKRITFEIDDVSSTEEAEVAAYGLACEYFDPSTQNSHNWDRIMNDITIVSTIKE